RDQAEVAAGGDGKELREPLRDAEDDGVEDGHARYEPDSATFGTTSVTPPEPSGRHSRSAPTAATSPSRRGIVEAMVASRMGSAGTPSRIMRPATPTEKSPDTGFTPECRPAIEVTRSPWSTPATSSSCVPLPGT